METTRKIAEIKLYICQQLCVHRQKNLPDDRLAELCDECKMHSKMLVLQDLIGIDLLHEYQRGVEDQLKMDPSHYAVNDVRVGKTGKYVITAIKGDNMGKVTEDGTPMIESIRIKNEYGTDPLLKRFEKISDAFSYMMGEEK